MPHNSFRWLQPPGSERWYGFFHGEKCAEVWAEGMRGNRIARWCWEVAEFNLHGDIGGTGNDDVDRYSAQVVAADAYLEKDTLS